MKYDYDAVVIGAGAAGLTASGIAASLGAKTLLVERDRFGGDCTWTGCVPSKTLLAEAKKVHEARKFSDDVSVDFSEIMARVHTVRENIYEEADTPEEIATHGVETAHGSVEFVAPHELEVSHENGTETVTARFVFIATGASPLVPPIDGLDECNYLTSDSLFETIDLPAELAIIGGGPIGVEMAQAFNYLGSEVSIFESGSHILGRSDADLAETLAAKLEHDGVSIHAKKRVEMVGQTNGEITLTADGEEFTADRLLVAVGRAPNVSALNLEAAGVEYEKSGIMVNSRGRTNQGHIYALGDATGGLQFTHSSEKDAKVAVFRALLKAPLNKNDDLIPRVTYTSPEFAEVGKTARELKESGEDFDTYELDLAEVDRAITEGETVGGLKVFTEVDGDTILGAAILAPRAGELLSEIGLAMKEGLGLAEIANTVHAYPTYSLALQRLAEKYYTERDRGWLVRLVKFVFRYQGNGKH